MFDNMCFGAYNNLEKRKGRTMDGNNSIGLVTKYQAKKDTPVKGKPVFGKKKTSKKGVKCNGIFSKQ